MDDVRKNDLRGGTRSVLGLVILMSIAGCGPGGEPVDATQGDMSAASAELGGGDLALPDQATHDLVATDLAVSDAAVADLGAPDLATPDLAPPLCLFDDPNSKLDDVCVFGP